MLLWIHVPVWIIIIIIIAIINNIILLALRL